MNQSKNAFYIKENKNMWKFKITSYNTMIVSTNQYMLQNETKNIDK